MFYQVVCKVKDTLKYVSLVNDHEKIISLNKRSSFQYNQNISLSLIILTLISLLSKKKMILLFFVSLKEFDVNENERKANEWPTISPSWPPKRTNIPVQTTIFDDSGKTQTEENSNLTDDMNQTSISAFDITRSKIVFTLILMFVILISVFTCYISSKVVQKERKQVIKGDSQEMLDQLNV